MSPQHGISCLVILSSLACCTPAPSANQGTQSQQPTATTPASAPSTSASLIDKFVRDLGDANFEVRQGAAQELWQQGQRAENALQRAAASPDVEVRAQAKLILRRFAIGDSPDVPEQVKKWSIPYSAKSPAHRMDLEIHVPHQEWTIDLAAQLIRIETELPAYGNRDRDPSDLTWEPLDPKDLNDSDRSCHTMVLHSLRDWEATAIRERVQTLVATGRREEAERIEADRVQNARSLEDSRCLTDYVALQAWRGPEALRASIAQWQKRVDGASAATAHGLLCLLHRAVGEYPAAVSEARATNNPWLLPSILQESHCWRELINYGEKEVEPSYGWGEYGEFVLRWRYFSGDIDAFQKRLDERRAFYAKLSGDDPVVLPKLKALQLCVGPDAAIKVWQDHGLWSQCFAILLKQERYDEAWGVLEKCRTIGQRQLSEMELSYAVALYQLGDKERALKLAGHGKGDQDDQAQLFSWLVTDARRANRTWETKAIMEHGLALLGDKVRPYQEHADEWYLQHGIEFPARFLPGKSADERIGLLADLLANRMPAKQQADLCDAVADNISKDPSQIHSAYPKYFMIGETLRHNGLYEAAWRFHERYARDAQGSRQLQALLDMAIEKSNWQTALDLLERQRERAPTHPGLIWLKGWLLERSGRAEEGRRLQELARWIPLGDSAKRLWVASAMRQQGQEADAADTYAMNLRVGDRTDSIYAGHYIRWRQAEKQRKYSEAAEIFLDCTENGDTLEAAFTLHRLRALAAMQGKNTTQAIAEAERAQEVFPARPDLLLVLIPQLDGAGEQKAADRLLQQVWQFNSDIIKAHSQSLRHHQNLALLALRCKRHTEDGKEHLKIAIALDPNDTLFQAELNR